MRGEVLYTFMLRFMKVAAAKESMKNDFYGLAFSHVIVASAYGAVPCRADASTLR